MTYEEFLKEIATDDPPDWYKPKDQYQALVDSARLLKIDTDGKTAMEVSKKVLLIGMLYGLDPAKYLRGRE